MSLRVEQYSKEKEESEFYGIEALNGLLEDDEITANEEGFMSGYGAAYEDAPLALDGLSPEEKEFLDHRWASRGVLGE